MQNPDGSASDEDSWIERLAAGDPAACGELITRAQDRMQRIAHRMLQRFPNVRRWDNTDDVVQNASIRLWRALERIRPHDARSFIGLAAVQIRRELLDLARKHAAAGAYAANHETNYRLHDGEHVAKVNDAADKTQSPDRIARWTRLHEAAAALPDEEREVFHLVWYLGLSQAEVAGALGYSTRTVKRRWESVKELMAEAMKDCPLD